MAIVVVGASAGIGAAIAEFLCGKGERVIGVGRRADPGKILDNGFFEYFRADITTGRDLGQLDGLLGSYEVDGWVNNVGRSEWCSIDKISAEFVQDMFATNLKSALLLSQLASRHLSAQSAIVNISSIAGRRGSANNSVYSSMKFGLIGLTQSLAKELGPKGIRVNSVSPVLVSTWGLRKALLAPDSPAHLLGVDEFLTEFTERQSALGRLPTALEVARVVSWLLSSESSAITGQNINVDCGVFPQ